MIVLHLFNFMLFFFGDEFAGFKIYADFIVDAHVDVGDPDQGEAGKKVSPPVSHIDLVIGKDQDEYGDVVAKAIFTRK